MQPTQHATTAASSYLQQPVVMLKHLELKLIPFIVILQLGTNITQTAQGQFLMQMPVNMLPNAVR
jgi:hypothetical protein